MTIDANDWLGGATAPPVNRGGRPAKDYSARGNRRLECPDCGFNVRTSAAQIRAAGGTPSCACGARMILSELRDRLAIEPDELQRELEDAGFARARERGASMADAEDAARVAWNDAMRDCGRRGLIIPPQSREHASRATRCQWDGGYCVKFTAGRYCPEHDPHELARASQRGV